jgi:membrane peptidoglycan carboxypeptidase
VTFEEIPRVVLDAVTTAEDRSIWSNSGFDPGAILAAAVQDATGTGGGQRGASTITQQLVRARLLPAGADNGDRYVRKVLEIIQSARLTAADPGETGKDKIITAYLNQAYFGHEAYRIAAAAQMYFGVTDLSKLTPAQAALLASLLKAPSQYDPYRYATKDSGAGSSSSPVRRRSCGATTSFRTSTAPPAGDRRSACQRQQGSRPDGGAGDRELEDPHRQVGQGHDRA